MPSKGQARSAIHHVVLSLWESLKALGATPAPADVERWGFAVHLALSSTNRDFHTHEHVISLMGPADPVETLAALYHDVVYVQVDLDVPVSMSALLMPLLHHDEGGWRLLEPAGQDPVTRDVLTVFGRKVGEDLTPSSGLNELASALVAVKQLERALTREQRLSLAACIEATIPFREDPGAVLATRLQAMGLSDDVVRDLVVRAIRFANSDVENFADPDPARFLDNTWKLLPETTPSLRVPTYTVAEYRLALMKMSDFLDRLRADRVFHRWQGEPTAADYNRHVDTARRNIGIATRYLRLKVYTIGVCEALSEVTGGNVPLNYFMGGIPSPGGPLLKRLEQFLPESEAGPEPIDPLLHRLLVGGRATPSSFDIAPAPLTTYLYTSLGERNIKQGVDDARRWWSGALTAMQFLEAQPPNVVAAIAEAASNIVETRAEALSKLATRLRQLKQAP